MFYSVYSRGNLIFLLYHSGYNDAATAVHQAYSESRGNWDCLLFDEERM